MKFPYLLIFFFISSGFIFAQKSNEMFNEQHRPQFHFTPEKNWLNDPNGLVYYKGEYHLFYQYNPNGKEHGYMHWGHAISTDLVHWEHLPIAVTPDNDSKDIETCTAFSGSGLVDHENITGLKKGNEETILLFYTSRNCGQRLAYSNDKGRTWLKYEKNPLIAFDETDDARDPKVIWHAQSRQYVMLLYRRPNNNEKDRGFSIYTSKNLINWEFKSHLAGFFECPDLVELPVNRRADDKKWVLFDGDGSYIIGNFDGEKFIPESPKLLSDYGKNYYATQTWSNIPKTDGRCIQIAWMKGGEYPEMPFCGQLTFPCELSLKKFPEGIKLMRKPIKEIENLHLKGEVYENKNLIPGLNKNLTDNIKGDCLHIIGTFKLKSADNFGFITRLDKENNGFEINCDIKNSTINSFGKTVKLKPIDGLIKLEILIDRTSVELFANDGELAMTTTYNTPNKKATGLYFFNTGGELLVEKLEIYPMKSMWEKPEEQKKEKKK